MPAPKISREAGEAALAEWMRNRDDTEQQTVATAVRFTLQLLATAHPGATLEVRVPPFGAVQCVEGLSHTRGTPPNVIEMSPEVWLALATGQLEWQVALTEHRVAASGTRASLDGLVPLAGGARAAPSEN